MKTTTYALVSAALLFISTSSVALADPSSQPGGPTTPLPFTVTCDPYTAPMISSVTYMPTNFGNCTFSIPQTGNFKVVGIYKGVPGNSVAVKRGFTIGSPASVLSDSGYDFTNAQLGDTYFAAGFSSNDVNGFVSADSYLQNSATGAPTSDLTTMQWTWGPTPPVSISSPEPGQTYSSGDSVLPLANIADLASYGSIVYTLNSTPIDPSQPLPLSTQPAGPATFVIAATDTLGNTIYATSTFTIADVTPPIIVINTPQNGHSYLQNDVSSVDATVTDNVAVATIAYALDGSSLDPTQMVPFQSLSLGSHFMVVTAVDTSGNVAYATSTFTLLPPDLTAPTITISSPTAGTTYTDAANVYLVSTITDASPIVAKSYTFNGATIDPTVPLPLLGAPLGPAYVSVAATDLYGNASSSTVNFVIKSSDVTPPTITITNPIAGKTYSSTSTLLAAATITDVSGVATVSYVLNGNAINPALPLPLSTTAAGTSTLIVTAADNFGNTGSSSVSFVVTRPPPPDTTAPVITIISPFPGKKYSRNDDVSIVATITDASPIVTTRYYFNGKLVNPAVKLDLNKAPLGYNTLQVIATDSFGNTGSSTSKFRVMPGQGTCIADITEAFDHKWIANKNVFKDAYEDCQKINDRGHDRDKYRDDDDNHHKGYDSDDRYKKAQKDIDDCYNDLDGKINN